MIYPTKDIRVTIWLRSYIVYQLLQTTQYRCGEEAGGKFIYQ